MSKVRGGEKLSAATKAITDKLRGSPTVRVGFLEGATYPDGTSVALVAAVQEFGSPTNHIPPRPFFRNMIAAKSKEWPKAIAENLKHENFDVDKTLNLVGEGIAGQLKQSIIDTNDPPLSPRTVAAKGFDKPLIDTGHMLNSIDHEVVRK